MWPGTGRSAYHVRPKRQVTNLKACLVVGPFLCPHSYFDFKFITIFGCLYLFDFQFILLFSKIINIQKNSHSVNDISYYKWLIKIYKNSIKSILNYQWISLNKNFRYNGKCDDYSIIDLQQQILILRGCNFHQIIDVNHLIRSN